MLITDLGFIGIKIDFEGYAIGGLAVGESQEIMFNRIVKTEKKPDLTARLIDLVSPIGKGQRSLIICPNIYHCNRNYFNQSHRKYQRVKDGVRD